MQRYSELPDDHPEEYMAAAIEHLQHIRALILVLSPSAPISFWNDFNEHVAPFSVRCAHDVGTWLFTAFKDSARFGPMLTQLKKDSVGTKKYCKDVEALCVQLSPKRSSTFEDVLRAGQKVDHGTVDNAHVQGAEGCLRVHWLPR